MEVYFDGVKTEFLQHTFQTNLVIGQSDFILLQGGNDFGGTALGGLDAYHTAERVARLSYAKVDRPLESREDFRDGWD